jgi:hypothetical protein
MATGPASVSGVSGANAGNDGEKSRDQKGSHTALLLLVDSNTQQRLEVPSALVTELRWPCTQEKLCGEPFASGIKCTVTVIPKAEERGMTVVQARWRASAAARAFCSASSTILISFALQSARLMFGSSEPNSNVMSLLQCAQFVWKLGLTFWARSLNTWEHFVHLILTLSSIMKGPERGKIISRRS